MVKCGGCGAETNRVRTSFDSLKGHVSKEECPYCAPETFQEALKTPFESKVWSGPEAMPNLYKQDADGVYRAKDELIADTVALWDKGPSEEAKEKKRATRRTTPMSEDELKRTRKWGEAWAAPVWKQLESEI